MKSLSILAVLSLLAITLPLTIASDPSPLQDFCVSTNNSLNGVFVNGKYCKDPKLVTADDFFFGGLQNPRPITNAVGSTVSLKTVNDIPGVNTLGLSFARIDFAINGQNPLHSHPRASEVLFVSQGTVLAGFFTSDPENRLFTKRLSAGDLFVFPQGLIHFQMNIGRYPAVAFATLTSQNPGRITIANIDMVGSNLEINQNILAKTFQLDPKIVRDLQTKFRPNV